MSVETETYAVHFDREARTVRAEGPGLYVPLRHGGWIQAGQTFDVVPVLQARETYINEDQGSQFGETDWEEPWTDDDIGALYRVLRKEYGGKVSRMYRDQDAGPIHIGWTFTKRMRYEDAGRWGSRRNASDYYTRSVWVELRVAWLADAPFKPVIAVDPPNLKGKP